MNKIWLIVQREFLNRVQKKSFLIATILIPLIFPALMAILVYVAVEQKKNATKEVILYINESTYFKADTSKFIFKPFEGSLDDGKRAFDHGEYFGLLYIPTFELTDPKGITLYTKISPSPTDISDIERIFETHIKDLKMEALHIDQELLNKLKTSVEISNVKISAGGQEKSSDSKVLFGVGMAGGILMYMFIFIYGAQIMQGIIEEKMSKVVEVIVSSVRPFQLMMGKIIGLASVGLLQFLIWIVLISTLTTVVLGYFGLQSPTQEMMQMTDQGQLAAAEGSGALELIKTFSQINWTYILLSFLFYFIGGYLLYGALFAAVGSAVDSPAEAQQFMFPITIPLLISYFALFTFILQEPHGTISIWLSIIPLTSPIAMMGRIGFEVPDWQLALSMILLVAGFIFTTWFAGRIYRVGILMHGTKVNYKVLLKWFMQKG
ncbi:MAG: ABC transporter permease [Cytophagales bacterium]|mgnify:CR=1 FL=1|nr:ABC transporter permease [Cytophagales bacterium]